MAITNTSRTLKYYRDQGYLADMVERWIKNPKHPAGGFRKDCFGFGDILIFNPNTGDLALVQSCGSDYSAHLKKIIVEPRASQWTRHHKLILIGWRKVKKVRGKKAMVWKPRIKEFTMGDFK